MTPQGTKPATAAGRLRRAAAEARLLARRGAVAIATAEPGTLATVAGAAALSWLLLRGRGRRR